VISLNILIALTLIIKIKRGGLLGFDIFFSALALMLVFEGILPFLSPRRWRYLVAAMASQNDKHLRVMGFVFMVVGVAILFFIHH
jgi:uncharacterized protein